VSDKIDIFKVLEKVDDFDIDFFNSLTADQKKTIPAYTLMLWLAGCKSESQIIRINEFLNHFVFDLGSHPDLLLKLALISSDNKPKRYNWVKKNIKSKKYSSSVGVIQRYYNCSSQTALEYVKLLDLESVVDIATQLGEQDDTIKKIKKEFA